jgi:type III pantothenate kinase
MNCATLIAVDIGNSLTKVGWFDGAASSGPVKGRTDGPAGNAPSQPDLPQPRIIRRFFTGYPVPEAIFAELPAQTVRWRVASVNGEGERVLTHAVRSLRPHDEFRVLARRDFPIEVNVDEPDRVGLDRLATGVAANTIRDPDRAAIIVCAGTALVVNVVSAGGAFEGGVILAGFRMQAKSLFETADLLPLAEWRSGEKPPPVIGKNTAAAIQSGLFWGAVGAVREIVDQVAKDLDRQPQVFVTGGDLARLAPLLGGDVRFVPNMVLSGIAMAARGE